MFKRLQVLPDLNQRSCFLWGARQVGKSTLLKQMFPQAKYYDLLLADVFEKINRRPEIMREELALIAPNQPIIIDEVQRIPNLLNEIHWLIVNQQRQFILCGSSMRKLKRSGSNLLGGRAISYKLFPLIYPEIPDFNLNKALNYGLLPIHYLDPQPQRLLQAYVGDYLKEEIATEALTRNIPAFHRFLEVAAFSNSEILNYTNIASECGVSMPTVKEYFQILYDTLLAKEVLAYTKKSKRRLVQAPKFYFFDLGITNFLLRRQNIQEGSEAYGKAFEHFIFQELTAHSHYSGLEYPITYWRTASQMEVDFVLGDHEVIIEIKGSSFIKDKHLSHLKAFKADYLVKKAIVVCNEKTPRLASGDILILPWQDFLAQLWGQEIIGSY